MKMAAAEAIALMTAACPDVLVGAGTVMTVEQAEKAKAAGTTPTILFHMCGHGHFDAASYTRYLAGELEDFELPEERIDHALETVPQV